MIDQTRFFERYSIAQSDFEQTGLSWPCLEAIYTDYLESRSQFEQAANAIAATLLQLDDIHSIKYRIKAPDHLIKKIIRKCVEGKPKYLDVNADNYKHKITDLIGIRALHLFKEDWMPIHGFIKDHWKGHEKPVANVRQGDPKELLDKFRAKGCSIFEHPAGYRSIHYIVKHPSVKSHVLAEIQVRTIFEEGWSEIDHRIRYPADLNDAIVNEFLVNFNRLAGAADEMGSFVKNLKRDAEKKAHEFEESIQDFQLRVQAAEKAKEEKDSIIEQLRSELKGLSGKPKDMEKLDKRLEELGTASKLENSTTSILAEFISQYFEANKTSQELQPGRVMHLRPHKKTHDTVEFWTKGTSQESKSEAQENNPSETISEDDNSKAQE
jgi:ppGpp synthetase/RelA/SpoT-type nucleotidyltranferase